MLPKQKFELDPNNAKANAYMHFLPIFGFVNSFLSMTRWICLVIFLPFCGQSQKLSTADLRNLKQYCTGVFSNEKQAAADTHYLKCLLTIEPLWPKRKDGIWLFVQKKDTAAHYQLWHMYLQDDTTLILQQLDFKDDKTAEDLATDTRLQDKLYLYNLYSRHGCEVYVKKNAGIYAGESVGKDCFGKNGIEYFTYKFSAGKTGITWNEAGFDKADKSITGNNSSGYQFSRHPKTKK